MIDKIINLWKTAIARMMFRREPSPECWAFSSVHNQTFNYNSSYLFLYVREHVSEIHPYYILNDDTLREELSKKYGAEYFIDGKTWKGINQILNCKVWFTSTAPPLYGIGFRKKYTIINLWHGVPLKKIGMEQENLSWFTRKYYKYLFADNYEAVLTTSKELVPVMSRSFLVEEERIKVWGQPRNDMLFVEQHGQEVLRKIYKEKLVSFKKAILYAPTFRDQEPTKLFYFEEDKKRKWEGQPKRERIQELQTWLENHQAVLFVRLHLYDQTANEWLMALDAQEHSRIRLLNEDRQGDIMEILNIFDLVMTDYSSIYIDYLITGKPLLFLPYDKEEYLKERGMNFEYEKVTPGPKPKSFLEFLNSMEELLYNGDSYVQPRDNMNRFFNEIQRPCCETICEYTRELARRKRT